MHPMKRDNCYYIPAIVMNQYKYDGKYRIGIDYGFKVDPTIISVFDIENNLQVMVKVVHTKTPEQFITEVKLCQDMFKNNETFIDITGIGMMLPSVLNEHKIQFKAISMSVAYIRKIKEKLLVGLMNGSISILNPIDQEDSEHYQYATYLSIGD